MPRAYRPWPGARKSANMTDACTPRRTPSSLCVESESLVSSDTREVMLQERGRDAAQRVLLNTPHPLTVLSDPRAYGAKGSISRHHNPFNYLRALGKTRRSWDGGSSEVNFDSPDVGPR